MAKASDKKPAWIDFNGGSRITPFLMFKEKCAEAAQFYCSIFENSEVISSDPMSATFVLEGQKFLAYNGGDYFSFTEGISLFVSVESQAELDNYWNKLIAGGGEESKCGWLKDKFGLSWQIIPTILMQLLSDPDRDRANRAMQAMLQMQKLSIQGLKDAADSRK